MIDVSDDIARKALARSRLHRRVPSHVEFIQTVHLPLSRHTYRLGSCPVQQYLLEEMDSGRWERIYVCGSPQVAGKTLLAVIVPALRAAIGARLPVGYALPTLADLDKAWAEKLRPEIVKSGYGDHLPDSGPGARGGRGHTLQFHDPATGEDEGMLVFLAGGAYGSTVAVVLADEIDQFRTAGGEPLWGAIEDIFARANAYGARAVRIGTGTVEHDENSIILVLVGEQGTGTRPWPRCPFCRRHQLIDPDKQLVYEGDDEETVKASARIQCAHCPERWDEDARQAALRDIRFVHKGQTVDADGVIQGPVPRTKSLGLLWNALETVRADLPDIAVRKWRAEVAIAKRGDYELMRKYDRYMLCRQYVQPAKAGEISNRGLAALSLRSPTIKRIVPSWARFLVGAQDVQGDRHYWLVLAYGPDDRWAIVDWGFEFLVQARDGEARDDLRKPTPRDRRRVLDEIDRLMREGWQVEGRMPEDPRMAPALGMCDVGFVQAEILAWMPGHPFWRALKGVGKKDAGGKPIKVEGKDSRQVEVPEDLRAWLRVTEPTGWSVPCWFVNGHLVRHEVHAGLLRATGDPASGAIPQGLKANDYLLLHLSAVLWTIDPKTGQGYWRENVHPRWDLLDLAIYALTGARWYAGELGKPPVVPIDISAYFGRQRGRR